MNAADIIRELKMQPHPEGGHYVQIHADPHGINGRPHLTSIYFLLQAGEVSHWHRVDATEIWNYHAGAPLELCLHDGGEVQTITIGPDVLNGQRPQGIVPAHAWQSARSLGKWTLVGCQVAPGFQFSGFELASPGWEPG